MQPTTEDFRIALHEEFRAAQKQGKKSIQVVSGDLHQMVGGYPGRNHRMVTCCNVMQREVRAGDVIVSTTPSGRSSTVTIEYMLPR